MGEYWKKHRAHLAPSPHPNSRGNNLLGKVDDMAIRFKCKCGTELNVADGMAGKQGKCPKCKNVLTVPSSGPSKKRAAVEDEDDVAEAAVVEDEDVVEADPVEDEEIPRKKRTARREDDDDEDDRPRKKRRRDEDDEDEDRPRKKRRRDDDDEDEEEDRPRKKSRRDDDDDDDDDRPRQSAKQRRVALNRAGLGVLLTSIGSFVYMGGLVLTLLCIILVFAALSSTKPGGMSSMGDILKIIGWLVVLCFMAAAVLHVVGAAFTITTPARRGALGLSIAAVSTSGVSLLLFLWLIITVMNESLGFGNFVVGMGPLNPFAGIKSIGILGGGKNSAAALYLLPLSELGRLTCFALYMWACGKSFKDRDLAKSAFVLAIVAPSVCAGMGLIMWILTESIKTPSKGLAITLMVFYFLVYIGVTGYYGFIALTSKSSIQCGG